MLGMVNNPPNHGPRLQKVKPTQPGTGLVLECALCAARRVTPSVLARAADIEGDWSLMALGWVMQC